MKIASWNVNSIKVRLDAALAWLKEAKPDVVALQEIKCQDENFPAEPFEALRDSPMLAPRVIERSSSWTGLAKRVSNLRQMPSRMLPAIGPITTIANSSPPRR